MQRRKTKMVKLNDPIALEKLLQESYTDVCSLISETGIIIHDINVNGQPVDSDDLAKLTKEKINALKVRDSAIKAKLDISKIMNDVIKYNGESVSANVMDDQINSGGVTSDAFDEIRKMLENE